MKHNGNKMVAFIGFAIISLFFVSSFVSVSNATTLTTGLNYKVKKGDQMTYTYSTYKNSGQSSEKLSVTYADNSQGSVTIKAGLSFTIIVCNVSSDYQTIFAQISYNNKSLACYKGITDIVKVAGNSTYYQNLVSQNSAEYQLSGTTLTNTTSEPFGSNTLKTVESYDTSTGWVTKYSEIETASNGTEILDQAWAQGTGSSSTPGFEVFPVVAFFIIVTPVVLLSRRKKIN